jgi:hypothetical protein
MLISGIDFIFLLDRKARKLGFRNIDQLIKVRDIGVTKRSVTRWRRDESKPRWKCAFEVLKALYELEDG